MSPTITEHILSSHFHTVVGAMNQQEYSKAGVELESRQSQTLLFLILYLLLYSSGFYKYTVYVIICAFWKEEEKEVVGSVFPQTNECINNTEQEGLPSAH